MFSRLGLLFVVTVMAIGPTLRAACDVRCFTETQRTASSNVASTKHCGGDDAGQPLAPQEDRCGHDHDATVARSVAPHIHPALDALTAGSSHDPGVVAHARAQLRIAAPLPPSGLPTTRSRPLRI